VIERISAEIPAAVSVIGPPVVPSDPETPSRPTRKQQIAELVDRGVIAPSKSTDGKSVYVVAPIRRLPIVDRRNDPCPCGSGRKFKRCHEREWKHDERLRTFERQVIANDVLNREGSDDK